MKCRLSHVTNSSSSSFIISRDQVKRKKLIKILLEIANEEYNSYDYDDESDSNDHYTLKDDVIDNCVAYRYCIKKATKKHPLNDYGCKYDKHYDARYYDNHWIINNDSCGRYDWDVIDDVLSKYGINWQYGYCD